MSVLGSSRSFDSSFTAGTVARVCDGSTKGNNGTTTNIGSVIGGDTPLLSYLRSLHRYLHHRHK